MTGALEISILQALDDKRLFGGVLRNKETWRAWRSFLSALFGLPMPDDLADIFRSCTGRSTVPTAPFNEAWLICGRRSGKSFTMALTSVFLAAFRDYREYLAVGERAVVMVIAADRSQARICLKYIKGILAIPALQALVETERADSVDLTNSVTLQVSTSDFRSVRGFTLAAAICDEIAFWPTENSSSPDSEVVNAVRPAMVTIPGALLICASSPYARKGTLWEAFRQYHGDDDANVLVWQAATRVMNPTVPQRDIDAAYERDPANAAAEFGGNFRTDVESFVSREVVDSVTVPGRYELPPLSELRGQQVAFVDPSGGSVDSMTLAISHFDRKTGNAVLDVIRERRPPFSPEDVVAEFSTLMKEYHVRRVVGDRWGGEFVKEPFRKNGIEYKLSEQPKSDIYRDSLAALNSGKVELLDNKRLIAQLCGLERRTARSGRDSIDHGPGSHDDIVNSALGALLLCATKQPMRISHAAAHVFDHLPSRNPFDDPGSRFGGGGGGPLMVDWPTASQLYGRGK